MFRVHRAFWLSTTVFAFAVGPSLLTAQTGNASIVGIVADASEAAIPAATVVATNLGTRVSRTVATNEAGAFTLAPLIPGAYEIKVTANGFKSQVQSNLVLQTGAVVKVDFKLDVGAVSESIEVAATAALLQTQEASVGGVVTTSQLERIPVNGRNFTRLMTLMAGTSDVAPPQQIGQNAGIQSSVAGLQMSSVNGQRQSDNDYTIDGVDDNIMYKSSVVGAPPMDSIQEFRVATNNSAEYGRNAGANVNVSIKSGTRDLHGSAYEYLRNNKFDANDWFANRQGRGKVPFHQNQYGISAGGPVFIPKILDGRNNTFWFVSWEGYRFRRGNTLINTTPIAAERTGDFSRVANQIYDPLTGSPTSTGTIVRQPFAGNQIPQSRINPAMSYLVNLYMPQPNNGTGLANNLLQTDPTSNDRDAIVLRGDRSLGSKDNFYARYLRQRVGQTTPSGYVLRSNNIRIDVDNVGVGWNHTFSPTTVVEFRYGYNHPNSPNCDIYGGGITRQGALSKAGIALFDPTAACGPLPSFNATGQFTVGGGGGETVVDTNHQFDGKLSKMLGHHSLKVGAGYWIRKMDATFANPTNGTADFGSQVTGSADNAKSGDSFATLLLGYPTAISRGLGIPFAQGRQADASWFFQDDWRISSKLTVNAGVRWEGFNRPHDAENKLGNVLITRDPQTGKYQGLLMWAGVNPLVDPVTGQSGLGPQTLGYGDALMKSRWLNFAPRAGMAYQMDAKTVIRTGFGMFYNTTFMQELNDLRKLWPYLPQQLFNPNSGTQPDLSITAQGPSFTSTQALGGWPQDPNNRSPYSMQWNLFVQRQLSEDLTLEVGYVGSSNKHLIGYRESNDAFAPGPGAVDPRRLLGPMFGNMEMGKNIASSKYNALQVKINKRFSHGMQIMANYTWGRSMDDQSSLSRQKYQDMNNRAADWSRSDYDIRHLFKVGYVYDLPFGKGRHFGNGWNAAMNGALGGWAIEGIAQVQSGQPIYVRTGVDQANVGRTYERPDVLRNPNLPVGQRTVDRWFDTSAFVLPKPFTFGNSGPNIVEADGRQVFDLSAAKKFPIKEQQSITFRAEFFNFPNHVNFGAPGYGSGISGNILTAPTTFGTITTATNARQIQLALRYSF